MSSVDIPIDLASRDAQAVARLLAAAAAPARPHELRGYESARRAFERAGGTSTRRSGSGMPLRRMIGVKAAAVAGALTVTGVAVAAEANVLPPPIQRAAHQMLGGVGVPDPDSGSQTPPTIASSGRSTAPGTPHPSGGSDGGPSSGHNGDPNSSADGTSATGGGAVPGSPDGTGNAPGPGQSTSADSDALALCRAYAAQQAGTGGALTGHDRQRLAALAGGETKIADFCARTLEAPPAVPQPTTPDPVDSSITTPSPSKDKGHGKPSSASQDSPAFSADQASSTGDAGKGHSHTPSSTHSAH